MALIPEDKIAEIRERADIVAIIGEHVSLRRAGASFTGLCPFHPEKTPSFHVTPAKQFFYCFGCQKSGDVFRFLMEIEGKSFAEVARDLARRAGVEIPENVSPEQQVRKQRADDERARLIRLCDIAAAWFEGQLGRSERALRYLDERGITEQTRRAFRLGYAPDAWDGLLQHLQARNVPHELAEKAGLLVRREEAARLPQRAPATRHTHYDRFRDRVIFPLINVSGEVIAFGGRVLPSVPPKDKDKEGAKYINSPESPIYKKGDQLYGLHAAKESIRKGRQVILVEGNFDVLSLHQHGVTQAVAPMGTALTETQVRTLKRLLGQDGHVVLMLDGDRAGRSATLKDIWLFSQANLEDVALFTGAEVDIRVAQLPDGEDPDTYVARDRAGFDRRLRGAKPAVDYVLDEAIKLAEHDNVSGKAKVLMQVAPLLQAISNPTTFAMYVDRLADELAIDRGLVYRHVKAQAAQGGQQGQQARPGNQAPTGHLPGPAPGPGRAVGHPAGPQPGHAIGRPARPAVKLDPFEADLLALCGDHPRLLSVLEDDLLDRLTDPTLGEMLREARAMAQEGAVNVYQLIDLSPPELRDSVASVAVRGTFSKLEQPEIALATISSRIRERSLQRERQELPLAIRRAEEAGDEARKRELQARMIEVNSQLQTLRGAPPQA